MAGKCGPEREQKYGEKKEIGGIYPGNPGQGSAKYGPRNEGGGHKGKSRDCELACNVR
jgi:hypothetical protein